MQTKMIVKGPKSSFKKTIINTKMSYNIKMSFAGSLAFICAAELPAGSAMVSGTSLKSRRESQEWAPCS